MGFMISRHPLTSFFTSSSLINVRPIQVFKVSSLGYNLVKLFSKKENKTLQILLSQSFCISTLTVSKTVYSIRTHFTTDFTDFTIQIYLFILPSGNEIITLRLRSSSSLSLSLRDLAF